MRMQNIFVAATLIGVLTLPLQLPGQSNALFGTWKLNLAKSKYSPGPAPKSSTSKIEMAGGGLKVTVDAVTGTGETRHYEYTAKFDGSDVAYKGNPDADSASWKRISDNTFENISKKGGQVTTTSRVVVTPDGKSRTNTQTGKNPQGQAVNNTVFYDKQ